MTIQKHDVHPIISNEATLLLTDIDVLSASSMSMRIKVHGTYSIPRYYYYL